MTDVLQKQWVCINCHNYRVVQEAKPEQCPTCGDDDCYFSYVYRCPYCDTWMNPNDPDDDWINCPKCEFQFESEWHDDIIKTVHKHLEFYKKRLLPEVPE